MEDELKDLTPEQQDLVDLVIGFQSKIRCLVESNRELFEEYGNTQSAIKRLHNDIIDAADVADGLAKQLELSLRRLRKETGINDFRRF